MQGLLEDVQSRIIWVFQYHIPCWLSAPFRYPLFKSLYVSLIGVLFLNFLPLSNLWELFRQILIDLWINRFGEKSLEPLNNLLYSFPAEWVLPIFLILFVLGIIVLKWAWPRYLFYRVLEDMGVKIIRGPGQKWPFYDRLQKTGGSSIGVGPSAKLLDIYLHGEEYSSLIDRFSTLRTDRSKLGILITGPATSGKTRTAMELVSDTKIPIVIVLPRNSSTQTWSIVPEWKGSAILFADNLVLSLKGGDIPLPEHITDLLHKCPNLILVGTTRKELLPNDLRGLEVEEMNTVKQEDLFELAELIADIETKTQRKKVDAEAIMRRYNGYPASLVAGLSAMHDIYDELGIEERSVLQATRVLWEMGVYGFLTRRIWEVAELLCNSEISLGCVSNELKAE